MATVPVPRTYVASENLTATILNGTTGIKGPLDFLLSPPRCSLHQTSTTSMATSGSSQLILFDTEAYDTDTMHSTSVNTSRITSAATGLYLITASLSCASNSTGYRLMQIRKNAAGAVGSGTRVAAMSVPAVNGATTILQASAFVQLTSGDYVEMFGLQNSGGALATVAGVGETTFQAQWVANS